MFEVRFSWKLLWCAQERNVLSNIRRMVRFWKAKTNKNHRTCLLDVFYGCIDVWIDELIDKYIGDKWDDFYEKTDRQTDE